MASPSLEAIRDFGLDPADDSGGRLSPGQVVGYFEAHIEQGPVLESLDQPLGVVTAIVGQSRYWLRFIGKAGTCRNATDGSCGAMRLPAAAEFVGLVEKAGEVRLTDCGRQSAA